MRKVRVAPKGMGLNDFVAQEEGFFKAEGIEVEWDMKTFRGTQSSWKGKDYFQRPQDQPFTESKDSSLIQCACVWGTISNASSGMGRFVGDCYGVSPWGIFVRPESKIRRPEDLAENAARSFPAGKVSAAGKDQDREHRRLRRAPQSIARR